MKALKLDEILKPGSREQRGPEPLRKSLDLVMKSAVSKTDDQSVDESLLMGTTEHKSFKKTETTTLENFGEFSMRNLQRKEAVAIRKSSDDEQDFEEMPFVPRKKPLRKPEEESTKPAFNYMAAIMGVPKETKDTVIADPSNERDWLLDPVNLYMRGMA